MLYKLANTGGRFLLILLLTLLAGLLIVSATGKFSISWPSLWVVAPEIRDSFVLSIFCLLLFLKAGIGPYLPQQQTPSFRLEPQLGARFLHLYWIILPLAFFPLYIYFRTLNAFLVFDDLAFLKVVTDIAESPSHFFQY